MAPVVVLLLISLHNESHYEQPVRGILWFAVAIMALCAIVILFTTLHRNTALEKVSDRIEHYQGKLNE
jgi:hypothetical protein